MFFKFSAKRLLCTCVFFRFIFFFLSAKKLYCKFVFFFRCVFFLIISLEIVPTNVYFFSPDLWLFAYYTGPKIVHVNVWVNVTLLSAKNCTSIFYLLLSFYSSWEDQSSVSFQHLRCVHFGCLIFNECATIKVDSIRSGNKHTEMGSGLGGRAVRLATTSSIDG